MRPRFTVRLALVAITILAAACYALFVRPSDVAYQCIRAIKMRDYNTAGSLARDHHLRMYLILTLKAPSATFVYAEALPREWSDIWSLQRRFIFRVGYKDSSNGRHVEWIKDIQMVAFIDGVDVHSD